MSEPNIYQRINACMKEIEYVQKDATVSAGGGGYKAVTHDAVVGLVRKSMVTHGIVVVPRQKSGEFIQLRDPKADIKQHFYRGVYKVDFVNIDNGEDKVTAQVEAHAMDTQDKAPGKAMSYAVKYAMLKVFSIETGENEESRYHEAPLYTEMQKDQFHLLYNEEDALGMACFGQEVGPDAINALKQTFPQGKLTEGKKKARELDYEGWQIIRDYVSQIKERIEKNDIAVLELTDELQGTAKRIVAGMLTDGEVAHLKNLKQIS